MKNWTTRAVVLVFAAVMAQGAMAAPKSTSTPSGKPSFWLGGAIDGNYGGANLTTGVAVPTVTAIWMLNDRSNLQFYVGIPTINPFLVGGGAKFQYTVTGDNYKGFHVGGGLGLGATGTAVARTFFINIVPTVGLHFEIVDNVLINLDGSLAFKLYTAGATNFDMSLGGGSLGVGASVVIGL